MATSASTFCPQTKSTERNAMARCQGVGRSADSAIVQADLLISHKFNSQTWRRPLCLQAHLASGLEFHVADDGADTGDDGRCASGRVAATWHAEEDRLQMDLQSLHVAASSSQSAALNAWRQLDPSFSDPDSICTASEYFPFGHATHCSQSFLQARLRVADAEGDEIFLVRDAASHGATWLPAPAGASLQGPILCRNARWWQHWLPPCFFQAATSLNDAGGGDLNKLEPVLKLVAVRVLHESRIPLGCSLDALKSSAVAAGYLGGFLLGTSWLERWRVCRVEEHCRSAHLGLWGWLFRLQHSVLAVHLKAAGGDTDMLYVDKNADIGVTWRRSGPRESFTEVPREMHGFATDMTVQDLWNAIVATRAFGEGQDVSNCQHFVQESLVELAKRGLIERLPEQGFLLRNQWIAEVLHRWGYLRDDFKLAPGGKAGQGAFQLITSGGSKTGATHFFCPWAEQFTLRPAAIHVVRDSLNGGIAEESESAQKKQVRNLMSV